MPPVLSGYRPLDPTAYDAVAADGLPRVARYLEIFTDDAGQETTGAEVQHVLYLNGGPLPQSMLASVWLATRGPLPIDPTPQQSADAVAAIEAARVAALAAATTKRQQILAIAQSAVGMRVDLLSNIQVRSLFAVILYEEGALDAGLLVRPLSEWVAPA